MMPAAHAPAAAAGGAAAVAAVASAPAAGVTLAVDPKSLWTEHTVDDGRMYWFNKQTGNSVWEKPAVLKTYDEILLATCPWKEYTVSLVSSLQCAPLHAPLHAPPGSATPCQTR